MSTNLNDLKKYRQEIKDALDKTSSFWSPEIVLAYAKGVEVLLQLDEKIHHIERIEESTAVKKTFSRQNDLA